MTYYKRLQNELVRLADKLGYTTTSDFRSGYSSCPKITRARALQTMVKLIGFVRAMDTELKEWCPATAKDWCKYLDRLERWMLLRPVPSDPESSLPTYQEMLMELCTALDLRGPQTFESVIAHLVKDKENFTKVKMLVLGQDVGWQSKIHDVLWG